MSNTEPCKQAQTLVDLHRQEQAYVADLGRQLAQHAQTLTELTSGTHYAAIADHLRAMRNIARELQGEVV